MSTTSQAEGLHGQPTGPLLGGGSYQRVCREVNEQIHGVSLRSLDPAFVCECRDPACEATIVLSHQEFGAISREPACFIVQPGHETRGVETVVAETERYTLVSASRRSVDARGLGAVPARDC